VEDRAAPQHLEDLLPIDKRFLRRKGLPAFLPKKVEVA
jgi:hypothetical protein